VACSLVAALGSSCTNASRRSDDLAQHFGFTKSVVIGVRFRHVVYHNHSTAPDNILHVYIEGDGTPFEGLHTIADDPTPADPLMLRLMASDRENSIDLGRPCYFGLSRDADCSPIYWTMRRYSPEVLESMETALRSEAISAGATRLELFGHSGGGSLAVLLAQRVNSVVRVVTIGANLDIDMWCRLHHYSLLVGSINPAAVAIGKGGPSIVHLVGEKDTNTPPWLIEAAAVARGGEQVRVIQGFTHTCCWASLWQDILAERP
jgi:hypothetical protein